MPLDEQSTKIELIGPALEARGWTLSLVAQEVKTGRVSLAGEWSAGTADYVLSVVIDGQKMPAAVLEAKAVHRDPKVGAGQARDYARSIKAPFAFATNGHAFVEVDSEGNPGSQEPLEQFPTSSELKQRHPIQQEQELQRQKEREEKERRERQRQEREREARRREEEAKKRRVSAATQQRAQENHNLVEQAKQDYFWAVDKGYRWAAAQAALRLKDADVDVADLRPKDADVDVPDLHPKDADVDAADPWIQAEEKPSRTGVFRFLKRLFNR